MTELIHQLNAAHNGLDFIIYVIMPVQFKLPFFQAAIEVA